MSYKLLLLLLIGLHCVAGKKAVNRLANQSAADAWVKKTLFSGKTRNCLGVNVPLNKVKPPIESTWTVAVLKVIRRPNEIVSYISCTGSLIHPQVVLAAAHCFQNTSTDDLEVLAGATSNENIDTGRQQQKRLVDSIIIHENFTSDTIGNDIALIFLKQPFTLNPFVEKICLAPEFDAVGINCRLTSWDLQKRNIAGQPQLMTYNATVVPNRKCQTVLRMTGLGKKFQMAKDTFCIGEGLSETAIGPNGGAPLVCRICSQKKRFVQVGVLSFGFETSSLPNVLTNVVAHRKWIRTTCAKMHFKVHSCLTKNKFS